MLFMKCCGTEVKYLSYVSEKTNECVSKVKITYCLLPPSKFWEVFLAYGWRLLAIWKLLKFEVLGDAGC